MAERKSNLKWTKLVQQVTKHQAFSSAEDCLQQSKLCNQTVQTKSPSYQLAFAGNDFLLKKEMRHSRLVLEFQKCEIGLTSEDISAVIVVFGGARIRPLSIAKDDLIKAQLAFERNEISSQDLKIKEMMVENSRFYVEAEKLGSLVYQSNIGNICTGGGPGIMEAACKGSFERGGKTVGLNIVLPFEQRPNEFITPSLCFNFNYFSIRKMHFLIRAKALIAFPGGYGTLDELFEALCLIQTKKMQRIPVVLFGSKFWNSLINFQVLVDYGTIAKEDVDLFKIVETAEEAWEHVTDFYNNFVQDPNFKGYNQ